MNAEAPLNAVCPYFTMFPLRFPLRVLTRAAERRDPVLDPFCGRGTTNLAARLRGMPTAGVDTHPVAAAVTSAKLITTTPQAVTACLDEILRTEPVCATPQHPFWRLAYHEATLQDLGRVRNALLRDSSTPARTALQAILLGALHGPLTKSSASYLSNQCPRTYAPKPRYAVNYWNRHGLRPPRADIRTVSNAELPVTMHKRCPLRAARGCCSQTAETPQCSASSKTNSTDGSSHRRPTTA